MFSKCVALQSCKWLKIFGVPSILIPPGVPNTRLRQDAGLAIIGQGLDHKNAQGYALV
jgi:hypothetical protein